MKTFLIAVLGVVGAAIFFTLWWRIVDGVWWWRDFDGIWGGPSDE